MWRTENHTKSFMKSKNFYNRSFEKGIGDHKRKYAYFLSVAVFFFFSGNMAAAENYIQRFDNGKIDWSNGIIEAVAVAKSPMQASNPAHARAVAEMEALTSARNNLLDIMGQIYIDSRTKVGDRMNASQTMRKKWLRFLQNARVVSKSYLSDGSVKTKVAIDLDNTFRDLALPKSIRQIDRVHQTSGSNSQAEQLHTGLVVDCRGIQIQCALIPTIMDEAGNVVYGPAYVSREYVLKKGMVEYVKNPKEIKNHPRVADLPLIVKGAKTAENSPVDIIISNLDAAKIKGSASNLGLLQECRVLIVVD